MQLSAAQDGVSFDLGAFLSNPYTGLLLVAGYLLGSIPCGYLIVKHSEGRDIRASGSGNIGAANVTRTAGKGAGALTLALDAAKGSTAVWLADWVTSGQIGWVIGVGLAAIAGHCFPVWLKFKGGKGVATGVGVFLPICWQAVAVAFAVWVLTVALFRYVSLASMLGTASLPILTHFLYAPGYAPPLAVTGGTTLAAVAIILKHRENIRRLAAGTEPKFKIKK